MPEISVSSLDPRVQKQLENAQTALHRGNFDYVIEVTTQVLKASPACLPVRRLQRAAQMKLFQSKNKLSTKLFGGVTQAGFLGGQYLSITPGGDDKMMTAGAFFESAQGSIDVMNLVGRFATGANTSNQPPAPKPAVPQGPAKAPDPGAGP